MGTRRRSAPSPDGPRWNITGTGAGTLLLGIAAVGGLLLTQLNSGGPPSPPPASIAVSTATPSPGVSASADPLLVRSIEALPGAVVRIEATGTFADPVIGEHVNVSHGSGFVVDPSGVVVTNSHVVTGAESIKAWVGAARSEHTAKVIGVSECSDLAVIQLDAREPLPFLAWDHEEVAPATDIYAAGFPTAGADPKLTRGIVSGAGGAVDAARLSVAETIDLDADVPAGSTGGPVVTEDGQVVAMTYADDEESAPLAISRDEVLRILPDLQAGHDFASVGLNGYAQEFEPTGIWVVSVKPDSPAGRAGILPGDVVTELDGSPMAANGTMAEYCEVLRAHGAEDPLSFGLVREHSGEALEGALNGPAVEPGFAFAVDVGGATLAPKSAAGDETRYTDDETLSVEVPPTWSEKLDEQWSAAGEDVGPGFYIAPDVPAFRFRWVEPGAFIGASTMVADATLEGVLDAARKKFPNCKFVERGSFTRGGYTGIYDVWEQCRKSASMFLTVVAENADKSHFVYVEFQAQEASDLEVLDRMLVTLDYDPAP